AGTLREIKRGFPYSECVVTLKNRTLRVKVKNWGAPREETRILVSLSKDVVSFLPIKGEEKEVLEFLIPLPNNLPEGESITSLFFPHDVVMDLEIASNRGDCLSIIGIVREISAKLDMDWELPPISYRETEAASPFVLQNEDLILCPYYTGKLISHVVVKPSPWEIARDLYLLGLRPINNVVDATNLVMMETGQPLHAFDAFKIRGNLVVIRRAKKGETITTIDGLKRELSPEMLVIADSLSPIAIAGIMGGIDTEVSPNTKAVFLESALFHRVSVRKTSKALGLRTEASARFERGVDPQGAKYASERVLTILFQEGDIQIARDWSIAGDPPHSPKTIYVKPEKINEILNCQVEPAKMIRILERLGFTVTPQDTMLAVGVPSFRMDVSRFIDIVEEIGRINGYEQIVTSFPNFPFDPGNIEKDYALEKRLREFLVNRGLKEAVTLSLVNPKMIQEVGMDSDNFITIQNPLSQEQSLLRPTLLFSLLEILRLNLTRGRRDFGIFEIGKVFYPSSVGEIPWQEELRLGMALCGYTLPPLWQKSTQVDFFTLKGITEELLEILGLNSRKVRFLPWSEGIPILEKDVTFLLESSEKRTLGWGGKLSERDLWKLNIKGTIYYLELRLEEILELVKDLTINIQEVNLFPAISRDISLVMEQDIPWENIENKVYEIIERERMSVEKVEVFDVFEDQPLPPGKKSLSFRCIFRSAERTLSDEEAETWIRRIKEELKRMKGVVLREEFSTP
ncbi:MAG: phenylalanine--tRNA ligase subunit beta, partial [Candidatus Caldatribacteriaceae bacterium]